MGSTVSNPAVVTPSALPNKSEGGTVVGGLTAAGNLGGALPLSSTSGGLFSKLQSQQLEGITNANGAPALVSPDVPTAKLPASLVEAQIPGEAVPEALSDTADWLRALISKTLADPSVPSAQILLEKVNARILAANPGATPLTLEQLPPSVQKVFGEWLSDDGKTTADEDRASGFQNAVASQVDPGLRALAGVVSEAYIDIFARTLAVKNFGRVIKASQEEGDALNKNVDRNTELRLQKIKDAVEQQKKADEMSWIQKIFGWLLAIVAAIAAVIATVITVLTAGASAPLMVAASMLIYMAVTMIVMNSLQEAGVNDVDFSLSGALTAVISKMLLAFGVDADRVDQITKIVVGSVFFVSSIVDPKILGNLISASAKEAGASEEAVKIANMVGQMVAQVVAMVVMIALTMGAGATQAIQSMAMQVANYMRGATQVFGAAVSITRSGVGIATAEKVKELKLTEAEVVRLQGLLDYLKGQLDNVLKQQKSISEKKTEWLSQLATIIDDRSAANQRTASGRVSV